jgi:type I restriction enzyme R subunit
MSTKFTESVVEEACLQYFADLKYNYMPGPDISQDGLFAERNGYGDVVLLNRLKASLTRINPDIPATAIEDAIRKVTRTEAPSLIVNNRTFHKMVTDGIDVQFRNKAGRDVT